MLKASLAVGQMLCYNYALLQLFYQGNNLNRTCGLAFFGSGSFNVVGIMSNQALRTLNIAHTGVCRTFEGVELLSKLLSRWKIHNSLRNCQFI